MRVINFSETNSVVNTFLTEMRNVEVQHDSMRFRRNIERIGEVMAYEISKTLHYEPETIQTPLAPIEVNALRDQIVLGTILRAGMPMHDGFFNYFDRAENAFISAYRRYTDESHTNVEIVVEYMAAPSIEGKVLILPDPMLATGGSMELAYKALLRHGQPKAAHFACIIASQQAVDYLQKVMPEDTTLWVAAIDPILNEHKYIVPGLGDAGDLCFGEKL
ncbi:MAG: uracil phosphoribosyltransferase [Paludibacteraceae bacterium]|nr:uracil phosphoribosyltransferase [Paludibacteraceae bacterium]